MMMMIPVQVIAFFIAVMVIPPDVREFTMESNKPDAANARWHLGCKPDISGAGSLIRDVYVLLFPDDTRPKVFKTFDSKEMQAWLIVK